MNDNKLHSIKSVLRIASEYSQSVDKLGLFPGEVIDALRNLGFLGALIPSEENKLRLTVPEICDFLRSLAMVCPSSALIYAMHLAQVACVIRHGEGSDRFHYLKKEIVDHQPLIGSCTTEAKTSGNVGKSYAFLDMPDQRFSFVKEGALISYATFSDYIFTTLRESEGANVDEQVLVAVSKSNFSFLNSKVINLVGMRGVQNIRCDFSSAGSASFVFTDKFRVINQLTLTPYAHLFWSEVWTGIAANSLVKTRRALRKGSPSDYSLRKFEELVTLLSQVKSMINCQTENLSNVVVVEQKHLSIMHMRAMNILKKSTSENCLKVVVGCVELAGFEGYVEDNENCIGGNMRNIMSGPIMINNSRLSESISRMSMVGNI